MRFLRCFIENYGCLQHTSFEFSKGFNQFLEPNGWGKSTFVSFLCAMLYGLDASTRRSISDNARKHYQPWQGGPFGGSLEFETNGQQYRVERFFGRREKEDSFLLYNLKTMQLSSDYSSNLGAELFGIDRAGYLKSTCILQGQICSGSNESVSASLARLFQADMDQTQYDKAMESINKAIHFYVKTGKRGEISLIEQELSSTGQLLQESAQSCRKLSQLSAQISDFRTEQQKDEAKLQSVREQISRSAKMEAQAHYNTLKNRLEYTERQLDSIEDFFQDQLPDESDIQLYLTQCNHLMQMEHQYDQLETALSPFAGLLPPLDDSADLVNYSDTAPVDTIGDILLQYHDSLIQQKENQKKCTLLSDQSEVTRQQLQQEQELLASSIEAEASLTASLAQHKDQLNLLSSAQSAESEIPPQSVNPVFAIGIFSLLALLFTIAGIAINIYWSAIPAVLFTVAALLISARILFHNLSMTDVTNVFEEDSDFSQIIQDPIQEDQTDRSISEIKDSYLKLQRDQMQANLQVQLHQNSVQQLRQKSSQEAYMLEQLRRTLFQLNQKIEQTELQLSVLAQRKRTLQQQISDCAADITSYLAQYYKVDDFQTSDDYETALHELETELKNYKLLLAQLREASEEIRIFLQEHPDFYVNKQESDFSNSDTASPVMPGQSMSELQQTESLLQNRISRRISQISQMESETAQLQLKADEYHALEEKEQRLTEHLNECRRHHRILSLTESYLKQSHSLFADNYMQSIEKHFLYYYQLFSSSEQSDFSEMHVSSDFKVLRFSQGQLRETDWYSQGIQDLTELCIRLSIIEDLFPTEAPVLILDDPFVNLDDDTLQQVSSFLHKLSEKWQILYLTCHTSRNLSQLETI